jgi:hypothetical protein
VNRSLEYSNATLQSKIERMEQERSLQLAKEKVEFELSVMDREGGGDR